MCSSEHQEWINLLYSQYKNKQINIDCEINLDEIEIKYRNIEIEIENTYYFEEEWLKYYPPLLKRQNGFFK